MTIFKHSQEIGRVRAVGSNNTDIIPISETFFFGICDDATGLAEAYSQRQGNLAFRSGEVHHRDIVVLMLLIGYQRCFRRCARLR